MEPPPPTAPPVRAQPPTGETGAGSSTWLATRCPRCEVEMLPEHAHYRCPRCGTRDSCCM
ncbi:MAG TPA: hypothetical protein VMW47_02805 [Verrucomicrobiae bacterium]|nr:hypothetical protein [Verrucomicrobiae bacterium]